MSKLCVKGIYSNGMVLQRNTANCIFGTCSAGSEVKLSFRGNSYSCNGDKEGNWKIEYNPGEAGGPFEMTLSCCQETIVYKDVFVGEVWVSSGQSNAQLPMNRLYYKYKEEFELPENPEIRIITVPIKFNFEGEQDSVENPQWLSASPENLEKLSGTAYFFAKKLQKELGIPVGIINASQGGSPVTAWMSQNSLRELGKKEYVERFERWMEKGSVEKVKAEVLSAQQKWDAEFYSADKGNASSLEKVTFAQIADNPDWKDCSIPGDFEDFGRNAGVIWLKKEITLSKAQAEELNSKKSRIWFGTIQDSDKIWINGEFCGSTGYTYPPRRYPVPAGCLKEGKNTVTVRVQKNGAGAIRFYQEKPYFIFTEDCYVAPSISRNMEKNPASSDTGVKIALDGSGWKKFQACEKECRPGEKFFEWEPSALYNGMLAPCFNYAVAGAIWYQGESNAGLWAEYKDLLVKMIETWREKFVYAPENMPFVVLQLPNWADGFKNKTFSFNWPELRAAQVEAVETVEKAGLAVLIDGGEWNDLHPEKKYTSGTRAALEALRVGYNKKINSAPYVECCEKQGKIFTVRFNCGTSVLKAYECEKETADFSRETKTVYGFEFLMSDGSVVPVEGKLISDFDVEISADHQSEIKELRYLWNDNPWKINLYSAENLPARPFKIQL